MSRSRATAKKAGASFERLVADYLRDMLADDRVDRRVKTGAKDRGDIGGVRTALGERLVIEAKNAPTRVDLAGWIAEARIEAANDDAPAYVIVHKRVGKAAPGEQWVTTTLEQLVRLIGGDTAIP